MIQILWKSEVHYTRENADDPLVLEALALIEKQTRLYGTTLYSVTGLPNPVVQPIGAQTTPTADVH